MGPPASSHTKTGPNESAAGWAAVGIYQVAARDGRSPVRRPERRHSATVVGAPVVGAPVRGGSPSLNLEQRRRTEKRNVDLIMVSHLE